MHRQDGAALSSPGAWQFGPFMLDRARLLLEENGQAVRLGSRAFNLLVALVERAGETVSRDELVARVWPTTVVEDTNLRVHIGALRKVLREGEAGARYIANIPGRGYSFVMPVVSLDAAAEPVPPAGRQPGGVARPHNLPVRLNRPIGRAGIVVELAERIERRRLVSIVGPGGMGKTTVAVAVAERRLAAYEHGARFVDLAPLSDPELVPLALGSTLGIDVRRGDPWPGLQAFLRDSRMLIVLDNCEHVIDAAARLAEFLLRTADGVHILATSREPLDAEGEWVHRLASLEAPDPSDELDRMQALAFPAIELFVERASAKSDSFRVGVEDLPALRRLCHLLDGMPLAIELAAGRVDGLGLHALADRLDDVLRLLAHGRRTALPRHQTLEALLNWSHDLLTPHEQAVLQRLSVFPATFTMRGATQVTSCDDVSPRAVEDCLTSLVAKSLVGIEPDAGGIRYRMLHTTRGYAAAKLARAGEHGRWSRRHATYLAELLALAYEEMDSLSTADWLASQRRFIDDIHAALAWAFSEAGDLVVGIALAAGAADAMLPGGLVPYVPHLERALERIPSMTPPEPLLELRLYTALIITKGLLGVAPESGSPVGRTFDRAMELAERIGSRQQLTRAMHGMCANAMGRGDYPTLDAMTLRIKALADDPSEPLAVLLADRLHAMGLHYLGNLRGARRLAETVLEYPAAHAQRHLVGQVPQAISMRGILARTHWLEGDSDRAVSLADEALDLATPEHPFALSLVLGTVVVPIALWRGDWARAQDMNDRLLAHATRHSQSNWQAWANNYRFVMRLQFGGEDRRALLAGWDWPRNPKELDMLGTLSEDLVTASTLQRVHQGTVGWCAAEVLRAHAVVQWRRGSPGPADPVERLLQRSLDLARAQQALAWELRTATSLARVWQAQGRKAKARGLLGPVLDRCVEGRSTADVKAALQLLNALH